MATESVIVKTVLTNDKLRFETALRDNNPIVSDYIPPLGDGQGYMPLELFLTSMMTCAGGTIVSLLRKMRKTVAAFRIEAEGFRRDEHPTYFEKIVLRMELVSPDATDEDMARCIELSEEKFCPVWAMIRGNVEVACEFTIHQA